MKPARGAARRRGAPRRDRGPTNINLRHVAHYGRARVPACPCSRPSRRARSLDAGANTGPVGRSRPARATCRATQRSTADVVKLPPHTASHHKHHAPAHGSAAPRPARSRADQHQSATCRATRRVSLGRARRRSTRSRLQDRIHTSDLNVRVRHTQRAYGSLVFAAGGIHTPIAGLDTQSPR